MDKNTAAGVEAKQRVSHSKRKSSRRAESKRDIINSLLQSNQRFLLEILENTDPQNLEQSQFICAKKLQNDDATSEAGSCSNEALDGLSNTENTSASYSAPSNSVFEANAASNDSNSLPALNVDRQKRTTFEGILGEDKRILQDCNVQRTGSSTKSQKMNDRFRCVDINSSLSGLNAGEKEAISKRPTGKVSRHLPIIDDDYNGVTMQSTDGHFSQSSRSRGSTDNNSTTLGDNDTSAFSESTCLGIQQERRKKTGKKRRTNKYDLILAQLSKDGFLSEDAIPELQSVSGCGTEVDVTLRAVGSADGVGDGLSGRESRGVTESATSSPPPADLAVRSNPVLEKCSLEKSVKKKAVASSDLKSKLVGKTPVTTFAGILKNNDKPFEDGDVQGESTGTNVKSSPKLQRIDDDSHLPGKNKKVISMLSEGLAATVAVAVRFKDASVQAEASHADASVQVDLCQCSCMTRGKALGDENLTGTLGGSAGDPVVQQLRLSSFTESPVKGGSGGRPSLYVSAASSVASRSTLSPVMQNMSLQVSMSSDELSYCGNVERDLATADSGKELPDVRKTKDLVSLDESHDTDCCHGGQLIQANTVEYSEPGASTPGEISSDTAKLDRARALFGSIDDDESPEKSNLVHRDWPLDDRDSSSSSEADRREAMQSTSLDQDSPATGLSSPECSFVPESPVETGLLTEGRRRSRGWKRVSMCAMNFKERPKSSSGNDSDQRPGTLSVVTDSDESFRSAEDHRDDTASAKALENASHSLESESSGDEFEKYLTATKAVRKERRSIIPMSKFIVDECEDEDSLDTDEDVEEETESDGDDDDDDDDGDGRKAIVISSDDELFNDKVCGKNNRNRNSVKELSERLKNFLISSDDDDDFSSIYYSTKKEIGKKNILPKSSTVKESEKSVRPERTLKFRTPGTFVSSRDRVVSAVTPHHPPAADLGQLPYTVGHLAPVRNGFLSSLDPQMKEHLRDFNAARFVNSFKSLRNELTAKLFSLYNERVFDMKIPSDTKVVWNDRMRTTAGWCSYRTSKEVPPKRFVQIELSVKVCNSPDRVRDTLIHEMCHAKVWIEYGVKECHGRLWKNWAQIANNALPELPRITVYHNYTITTKYVYRCTRCGSRVGRHSKSLDTEKFFCKFCFGQFELLVQSQSGAEGVFKTPRPPNQFAQFIKENYSEVKKTTPGFTHSEIMKLIGQRYSAKKSKQCLDGQKLDFSE